MHLETIFKRVFQEYVTNAKGSGGGHKDDVE